jgi:DNA-directed RNA polymerase subunit RPC12/RpoP
MDRPTLADGLRCPDCGQDVSATKGGQPLPDEFDQSRTFGWRCTDCHNVIPSRAFSERASSFNDRMRGVEIQFRDGHERFIPVPIDGNNWDRDTETDRQGGDS